MNIITATAALIIVLVGIYFGQTNPESVSSEFRQDAKEVIDSQEFTPTPIVTPTTKSQENVESGLVDFIYPDSNVVDTAPAIITLRSSDNVDSITNWYKKKIKERNMNVTSFVTTRTNDNIFNKLVGADGEKEIRIEIKKESGNSEVVININLN